MNLHQLGRVLKQARIDKGFSVNEVAQRVGINRVTLYRYEDGQLENMSLAKFIKLTEVLEIKDWGNIRNLQFSLKESRQERELQKIMRRLKSKRQLSVLRFAKSQMATQVIHGRKAAQKKIIYADGVLSAGVGEFLDSNVEKVPVSVFEPIPQDYDYAFKINGHSMEPYYINGQIIFVKSAEEYRDGQIIAAVVDNNAFLKRLKQYPDHLELVSLNEEYPNVVVTSNDDYRILGSVLL